MTLLLPVALQTNCISDRKLLCLQPCTMRKLWQDSTFIFHSADADAITAIFILSPTRR
jgi:hypothetical protein